MAALIVVRPPFFIDANGLQRGRACRTGRVTLDEAAGVEGQSVTGFPNGIVTY